MMVALLLHAFSHGIHASRRFAKACGEGLDVMAVTGMQRPDLPGSQSRRTRGARYPRLSRPRPRTRPFRQLLPRGFAIKHEWALVAIPPRQ
jgi:hypothetical protein